MNGCSIETELSTYGGENLCLLRESLGRIPNSGVRY